MKGKELKLEEIEAPHTLAGAGEGRVQGRGKWRVCTCYSAVRYTTAKCSRRNRHEANHSIVHQDPNRPKDLSARVSEERGHGEGEKERGKRKRRRKKREATSASLVVSKTNKPRARPHKESPLEHSKI
jgi:hypothetical protein